MKKMSLIVIYVFKTLRCPANKLEWYRVMNLLTHVAGTAWIAISFSGVILNNSEWNRMYLSANVSTFLTAAL